VHLIPFLQNEVDPVNGLVLNFALLKRWESANAGDIVARDNSTLRDLITRFERSIDLRNGSVLVTAANVANARALSIAATTRPFTSPTGSTKHEASFRRALHSALAMGINMARSPYPACNHYHEADAAEVTEGFSRGFLFKHVSDSKRGDRAGKRMAEIRADPANVFGEDHVGFFGNAAPASSLLEKDSAEKFRAEVRRRQAEFTQTYEAVSRHFAKQSIDRQNRILQQVNAFGLIDGIVFVSTEKYTLHSFQIVHGVVQKGGGEENSYVSFGVACDEAGTGWAVHHLVGTNANRLRHADGVGADVASGGLDGCTTFQSPLT
jgi:hypothetical protein